MTFPYDATGIEVSRGNFDPLPEGMYDLQVVDASEKLTRNGDQMVNVAFEVVESLQYEGRKVWHNVVFFPKEHKAAGMAIHFLKTLGLPFEGKLTVNTQDWIGKRCRAKLGIETYTTAEGAKRTKNAISFIEPSTTVKKVAEEVPF